MMILINIIQGQEQKKLSNIEFLQQPEAWAFAKIAHI